MKRTDVKDHRLEDVHLDISVKELTELLSMPSHYFSHNYLKKEKKKVYSSNWTYDLLDFK